MSPARKRRGLRAPRAPSPLLGAHVSAAGGVPEAPARATAIEATALQLFTKMANRWAERECEEPERTLFRERMAATVVGATMAHDSYLINLASPDPVLRARSIASFAAELRRCTALGLQYLVSHPGNFMDDRASGIARNADAITEAMSAAPGDTILCLETTVGSGTSLGSTFGELADIIGRVDGAFHHRIGVCFDTCHVYSAGYDIVARYDEVIAEFEQTLGLASLRVMHLNDSKTPFASHRDRHELIAEGSLGAVPFQRIMTDDRLSRVPKVLETPKGDDGVTNDRRMLNLLRAFQSAG